jgi:hypothetical protein
MTCESRFQLDDDEAPGLDASTGSAAVDLGGVAGTEAIAGARLRGPDLLGETEEDGPEPLKRREKEKRLLEEERVIGSAFVSRGGVT